MGQMKDWIDLLVGVVTLLVALAGFSRWTVRSIDRSLDAKLDARLDAKLAEQVTPRFDALETRVGGLERKVDALDTKMDGVEERLTARIDAVEKVTDVRLKALEADMHLVKQHLLGNPSAA